MQRYSSRVCLCVMLTLTLGLFARPSRADVIPDDEDRPIRLFATAFIEPIGSAHSLGEATINGRRTRGEQMIWAGDRVEAPAYGDIHLSIDDVGKASLTGGAVASFAAPRSRLDDGARRRILIANLARGGMKLKLKGDAAAYIEAGSRVLTSSRGAIFNVEVRESEVKVETLSGTVDSTSQNQQRAYKIAAYGRGLDISVGARSSSEVQVRVTDAADQPLPDVPVSFALTKGIGMLSSAGKTAGSTITVTTGPNGVASATFAAGPSPGSTSITATAGNSSITGNVSVTAGVAAGVSTATKLLIGLGAGGAAAVCAAVCRGSGSQPAPPAPANQPRTVVFNPPNVRP